MIKKFEEFVNEGLISDYIKQKEAESREISASDKKFVFDFLNVLDKVDMPFIMVCKNCGIINDTVNRDKLDIDREKIHTLKEAMDMEPTDIHISEKSILIILDDGDEKIKYDGDYKNIWKSIYKWFDKKYEKMELEFSGKIRVSNIIKFKNDIKKELF